LRKGTLKVAKVRDKKKPEISTRQDVLNKKMHSSVATFIFVTNQTMLHFMPLAPSNI